MELQGSHELAATLNARRILIVEDDCLIAMQLESVLRDAGAAEIESCSDVNHALQLTHEHNFDAAILDVRLANEDVTLVARQLAACGTPFIFYTGQAHSDVVLAEWPRCKVLTKPSSWRTIIKGFAELLN